MNFANCSCWQGLRVVIFAASLIGFSGCANLEAWMKGAEPASKAELETPEQKAARLAAEKEAKLNEDFQAAVSFHRSGDLSNARKLYEGLTEAAPERAAPFYNLARIDYAEKDFSKAEVYLDKALELVPDHHGALVLKGLMARERGDFEAAEATYRRVLEADDSHVAATLNLAILLDLYQGKLADALAMYERYKSLVKDSDPRVKDWIFDLTERLKVVE